MSDKCGLPEYRISCKRNASYGDGYLPFLQIGDGENCRTAKYRTDYACSDMAECIDDESIHGYTCNCTQGYRGDGYKAAIGCQDIDECEEELDECEKPPLGMCTNTVGSYICNCTEGGNGSGLRGSCQWSIMPQMYYCQHSLDAWLGQLF
ncbi:hypothetical protein L7F22_058443 [Adiantum nelumboides]|nr:hypothetical protein [Adiantum nelumboides]